MRGFRPSAGVAPCPCGGGPARQALEACCGPLLRGERLASTAEQLMRSRFSAFALGDVDHLLRTHPPRTDGPASPSEAERRRALEASCRAVRWRRLEILATEAGGAEDLEGTVTFRAHYQQRGAGGAAGSGVMEECSRFGREGGTLRGAWLYLEALSGAGRH
jgi:SEC-C motif-containing protein